jgi:hypothetical protein
MKKAGTIYHLAKAGEDGVNALSAAINSNNGTSTSDDERFFPFAAEHRISEKISASATDHERKNPYFKELVPFLAKTYNDPDQAWRRIDSNWLSAFGQLALDLDGDTNNTSLVLAFEFVKSREVLLFVVDAQVGNWKSWANLEFKVPGRKKPMPAHELLNRTVFYKVGHHCSHNGTIRNGGLELMTSDDLVAFIALDIETAQNMGKSGWDMPAAPLYKALNDKAKQRVVISDRSEIVPAPASQANVCSTNDYIDFFLV